MLAGELTKLINHFFPNLISLLKGVKDKRNQSYVTYGSHVILMTRILSSIFYISSMRKTSEKFNSTKVIENIGYICGENLEEIPHWSTINDYLEKLEPEELERIIETMIRRLLQMKVFNNDKVRGKYWKIIIDGTGLINTGKELDKKCLVRVHKSENGEENYRNYEYYVLEAKLWIMKGVVISIGSEFVENKEEVYAKQDCELNAAYRLLDKIYKKFPRIQCCIIGDSLYAGGPFFKKCKDKGWKFIIRLKQGKIPGLWEEYNSLTQRESHKVNGQVEKDRKKYWCDYAEKIDYQGMEVNVVHYEETIRKTNEKKEEREENKKFTYVTNLSVKEKNQLEIIEIGRGRWKIENEGFNCQKRGGYYIEHMYSYNYQTIKNHYLLIQIAHLISQLFENWKKIKEGLRWSLRVLHEKIFASIENDDIREYIETSDIIKQVRFV